MKKTVSLLTFLALACVALLPMRALAQGEDLLKFGAFLERKSKELTITVVNVNDDRVRLSKHALAHPLLSVGYRLSPATEGRDGTLDDNRLKVEATDAKASNEIIVLAPGEELKINVPETSTLLKLLREKNPQPIHNVRLYIRFANLVEDLKPTDGQTLHTEGPVLELGSSEAIWPGKKAKP